MRRMRFRSAVGSSLLALLLVSQAAVAQQTDTLSPRPEPLIDQRGVLIVGGLTLAVVALTGVDRQVAREFQRPSRQENPTYQDIAAVLRPIDEGSLFLVSAATYAAGRIGDRPVAADIGLHAAEALLIGTAIGTLLKGAIGRARPAVDVEDPYRFDAFRGFEEGLYRSFPSLHTIGTFGFAAAFSTEVRERWPRHALWVMPIAYGTASVVGLSRLYDNKHWVSDAVMGAIIGTVVGIRTVRFHHSRDDDWLDRVLLAGVALPDGHGGALVVTTFRF